MARSKGQHRRHNDRERKSGHWSTCEVTGKRRFQTRAQARRSRNGTADGKGLSIYRCESCGDYHIGHHRGMTREEHREHHRREADDEQDQ